MSGAPDLPFNAIDDRQLERWALAVVCGLDGLAISQAFAVLDRARMLIGITQRIVVTPELIAAAEASGSDHVFE